MNNRERAAVLLRRLPLLYPDARCLLQYDGSPEKLLISTILSARTTDEAVNRVTPLLWKEVKNMEGLAEADSERIRGILHPLGFFRAKTRSVQKAAKWLLENGGVPDRMEELVKIPGVGRKTANVVLGEAFGRPAIVVDTHVKRLADRLDLTRLKAPDRIEFKLKRLLPKEKWTSFSHQLGFHGRRVCASRKPSCGTCGLSDVCPRRGVT